MACPSQPVSVRSNDLFNFTFRAVRNKRNSDGHNINIAHLEVTIGGFLTFLMMGDLYLVNG